MTKICQILCRRKPFNLDQESELKRILKLLDLVALGVGSTLGLGVYVLAGQVAYNVAGPGVIISFVIAAIASLFAAVCYAEFASRVPKTGSAYTYSYVAVGEFIAFFIGWNMVLEYILGTASLARGLSNYLDTLFNGKISEMLSVTMPLHMPYFAEYPDFFAFAQVLLLTALLAFGVKESSTFNIFCTTINLITISIMVIAGSFRADFSNWNIPAENVPAGFGAGGFLPFGLSGVVKGAAKCFFGFVGFDGIATTAEEAINPKRNIPIAILLSLVIVMIAYFGISIVLTLMVPYYEQSPTAPFPIAFERVDWITMKNVVSIGALFALTTALLGAMFPLPRILYSMGSDGVIYRWLSSVNACTKTPVFSTIISGIIAALMALLFDVNQLVDMMSIGTLMAYTIVAICVIILRYQDEEMEDIKINRSAIANQLCNGNSYQRPNVLTSRIAKICTLIFGVISMIWCTLMLFYDSISISCLIIITGVSLVIMLILLVVIALQPVSGVKLNFHVPLVPFVPAISVIFNIYLMTQLNLQTWIRLLIWITLGYIIYFTYGVNHSKLAKAKNEDEEEDEEEVEVDIKTA